MHALRLSRKRSKGIRCYKYLASAKRRLEKIEIIEIVGGPMCAPFKVGGHAGPSLLTKKSRDAIGCFRMAKEVLASFFLD